MRLASRARLCLLAAVLTCTAANEGQAGHGIGTKCVHGANNMHDGLGSLIMPIYQTSTFRFKSAEHGAAAFAGENDDFIYTRINNPTVRELEETLAVLEHGAQGICVSSGMAAINAVFFSLLAQGAHVISHETVYGPSRTVLEHHYTRFGVEVTFVDTSNTSAVAAAIRHNTVLIYLESPSNPTVTVSDIPEICKIAKEREQGIVVCVDNTFLGPALQNPLDFGADLVVHSMTKSINGHADLVGGCIVAKDAAMAKKLRATVIMLGFTLDPHAAFLTRRGLKTLPLRVERAQDSAARLAMWLEAHPKIAWVKYPGLESHPQHALCMKIMKGPGTMMSFGLKGGIEAGKKVLNSVKLCALAVSLGGVETLIQHPASMTHAKLSPEARLQGGVTDDLVRFSVGIEDCEEIMADLAQALEKA